MIPLWQLAMFFGLSEADTQVLTFREDFPEPTLMLPKYTYWNREEIIAWITRLKLKPADLPALLHRIGPELEAEAA